MENSRVAKKVDIGWLCGRIWWVLAFFCLFGNTASQPYRMIGVLAAAIAFGVFLLLLKKGAARLRGKRGWAVLAVCVAVLVALQIFLRNSIGGLPQKPEDYLASLGRLGILGKWNLEHWDQAVSIQIFCVDLGIVLLAAELMKKNPRPERRLEGAFATFSFLAVLLGLSPWIFVPQPILYSLPLLALLAVLREKEAVNGRGQKRLLAEGAILAILFAALWGGGLFSRQSLDIFSGKNILELLYLYFERICFFLSDGLFGWGQIILEPFSAGGWALRLQNTMYPGGERYGFYAGVVQGVWVLFLWLRAWGRGKTGGNVSELVFLCLLPLAIPEGMPLPALLLSFYPPLVFGFDDLMAPGK